jgi:6-hydroxytryprostatin B O-methyltransferase
MVQRVLRHAITRHIFAETSPGSGKIVHTCISAAPVKNPLLRSWIGLNLEEFAPASLNLVNAIKRYGESAEPFESAGVYTHFRDSKELKTLFEWFDADGEGERKGWRARRCGEAMVHIMRDPATDIKFIHDCYDWDGLGEAIVVDVSFYSSRFYKSDE